MTMRSLISKLNQESSLGTCLLQELHILAEGATDRYMKMFGGLPELETAKKEVEWARKNLVRDDRIVWFLRWYRVKFVFDIIKKMSLEFVSQRLTGIKKEGGAATDPAISALNTIYHKIAKELAKQTNISEDQILVQADYIDSYTWRNDMKHLTSMFSMVSKLNDYQFKFQTPNQIRIDLLAIEKEYIDSAGKHVDPTENDYDGAQKIIDFGDGFAWWNLGVRSCSIEGGAMGHCGNAGSPKKGDQVLSLRKREKRGSKLVDVPFLTFILDKNGLLGEMKGRGNAKPAERYHRYIIPLLLSDYVNGIKGGGYLRQNNFSLNDLPPETKQELLDKKPDLGNEKTMDHVINVIREYYNDNGIELLDDGNVAVWQGDLDELNGGSYLESLKELVQSVKNNDVQKGTGGLSDEMVYRMIHNLSEKGLVNYSKFIGAPPPSRDFGPTYLNKLYVATLRSGKAHDFLVDVISNDADITMKDLEQFIKKYIYYFSEGTYAENLQPQLSIPQDVFNGTFYLTISQSEAEAIADSICEIGDEDEDGYEGDGYGGELARCFDGRGGFFTSDDLVDENVSERLRENDFIEDYTDKRIMDILVSMVKGESSRSSNDESNDPKKFAQDVEDALVNGTKLSSSRPTKDQMGDLFDEPTRRGR